MRDKYEARRRPDSAPQMTGPRTWVPLDVLQSKAFADVSGTAKGLFFCMIAQLRIGKKQGGNNGDLTTAIKVLKNYGWKCHKTIARAANELEEAGLIVKTRQGRLPNLATLYAVTYAPLDKLPNLEITVREFPYRQYLLRDPAPALKANDANNSLWRQ